MADSARRGGASANELAARIESLSDEQRRITQDKGTEPPFTGHYLANKADGTYHCVVCETPLFSSEHKYESGSGWPSFYDVHDRDNVGTKRDRKLFMVRTEVHCDVCGGHLGHVFEDGPAPTGLRYCMNSAAMEFLPEGADEAVPGAADA